MYIALIRFYNMNTVVFASYSARAMKIHSSSISLQSSTSSRPKAKISGANDVRLDKQSQSQKQLPNQQPSSPDEIKKILSTVVSQIKPGDAEGFDTRTSKALNAYRRQSNLSIAAQNMPVIAGIDVYA